MGKRDSSQTRAAPVFDKLKLCEPGGGNQLEALLRLATGGHPNSHPLIRMSDVRVSKWGECEARIQPPLSLLAWLIRNLPDTGVARPSGGDETSLRRRELFDRNPMTVRKALKSIHGSDLPKAWYVLEGSSQPDVYIETDEAVVVVEGKRTEPELTVGTTWMPGRHQILRHIDGAWEVRGHRKVYALLIVEGDEEDGGLRVPSKWVEESLNTVSTEAISSSLPHRGPTEQLEIARCFRGVTTWQAVCRTFDVDWRSLPDTT